MLHSQLLADADLYREYLMCSSSPVNLVDEVILPDIFRQVITNAEAAARATHEKWLANAIARGVTNEDNPNCVPYDELSEETKASNISVALRTYKIFVYLGVGFTNAEEHTLPQVLIDEIINEAVELIHDGWSKDKMDAGWVFATERNDELKHHTDLVPMDTILAFWPEKAERDRNAVIGALKSLAEDYGIYPCTWDF